MAATPGSLRAPLMIAMALLALFAATLGGPAPEPPGPAASAPPPGPADGLSDAELVGQVLMPYVYGDHPTDVPPEVAQANQRYAGVDTAAELVERFQVGGVILLGHNEPAGASNVTSPEQIRELTDGMHGAAARPLLVGIDQEYGVVSRLTEGVTNLPSPMAFGAARRPDLTETAWRAAGTELAALGVNLDFAPVADVLAEDTGGGGIIGSRSYGTDPVRGGEQVAAAVRGLQAAGVGATLKHFPGHGNTDQDSHTELPVVPAAQPLAEADLPPFTAGIDAGAGLVMAGHLDVRGLDPGVPASFSPRVMTDLLRDELGFEGVAVTDALNMEPARQWPPGEAAVRALLAGNDLLLMPPDLAAARQGVLDALADGTLPRERLVEAATRVLALNQRLAGRPTPALSVLDSPEHHEAVAPLAAAAVTVLRGPCPPKPPAGPVTVTAAAGREQARDWLADALAEAGVKVRDSGGRIVHLVGYGDTAADLREDAAVTVAMDTPYLLAEADSGTLLATYSSSLLSMRALAEVIAGQAPAPGRSPVAVTGVARSTCDS